MLQQARQRADENVGDVCHLAKKLGTGTARTTNNALIATNKYNRTDSDGLVFQSLAKLIEKGVDTSVVVQVSQSSASS